MNVSKVYKCLSDPERLRIVNLLTEGPLCVCHLMELLGTDQVKVSKQLRYMKELGMVEAEREANWMIYRLAASANPALPANITFLRESGTAESKELADDLKHRQLVLKRLAGDDARAPGPVLKQAVACC